MLLEQPTATHHDGSRGIDAPCQIHLSVSTMRKHAQASSTCMYLYAYMLVLGSINIDLRIRTKCCWRLFRWLPLLHEIFYCCWRLCVERTPLDLVPATIGWSCHIDATLTHCCCASGEG